MRTAAPIMILALVGCDTTITTTEGSGGADATATSTGPGAGPSTGAMGGSMQ
jgi:hypothetical protein